MARRFLAVLLAVAPFTAVAQDASDGLPPGILLLSRIKRHVRYARMPIGGRTILLPQAAEMDLVEASGVESRNVLDFTHCRALQAESTISFAPATGLPPSEAPAEELPAGVAIAVTLSAPITGTETVGSVIEGRVTGKVSANSGVPIRDGAIMRGRIRRLEPPLVALEFTEIETGGNEPLTKTH